MEFIGIGESADNQYAALRKELDSILAQRTAYEIEADAIHSELMSPGPNGEPPAGVKEPLTDAEGFPRGDIDIYNIRQKRHRLAEINFDYRQLMKRVEEVTRNLFALKPLNSEPPSTEIPKSAESETSRPTNSTGSIPRTPMVILDEVLPDSPAFTAGVRNGDRLLQFGHVTHALPNFMQAIAKLVGESVQKEIAIVVQRRIVSKGSSSASASSEESNEEIIHLLLVPSPWGGRGLLGCHLSPIK